MIIEVEPTDADAPTAKPETTGIGDSLDFTGEEPPEEDNETAEKDWVRRTYAEDDKSEEDEDGESFVSFEPVTPPEPDV